MIDSHAHIYLDDFKDDLDQMIKRAKDAGVTKVLMPNIDKDSIDDMLQVEQDYPEICSAMIGLHPCSVKEDYKEQLALVETWLNKRKFLAVGEIGTDLYWDKSFWPQQQESFHFQCELALQHNLPIVIHCRESIDETIDMVAAYEDRGLRGVFHCFTGSVMQAEQITGLGFYLGIGGVSTFKNGGMDQVIPYLDKSKIILETDSPYLTPVPHRGKRNEPAYVSLVADKVGEYLQLARKEVIKLTVDNTHQLFFNP